MTENERRRRSETLASSSFIQSEVLQQFRMKISDFEGEIFYTCYTLFDGRQCPGRNDYTLQPSSGYDLL